MRLPDIRHSYNKFRYRWNETCGRPKTNSRDLLNFITSLPNSNVYQFIFTAYPSENVNIPGNGGIDIARLFSESLIESRHEIQTPLLQELSARNQKIQEISTGLQFIAQTLITKDQQLLELTNRVNPLKI